MLLSKHRYMCWTNFITCDWNEKRSSFSKVYSYLFSLRAGK